jgi:hypothetical protein
MQDLQSATKRSVVLRSLPAGGAQKYKFLPLPLVGRGANASNKCSHGAVKLWSYLSALPHLALLRVLHWRLARDTNAPTIIKRQEVNMDTI